MGQSRLDVGGPGPQEGDHPHPEEGARAADADGRGHAGDVARPDAAAEGHGESLEGGHSPLRRMAFKELADHVFDQPDLEETGPDGEIDARSETQHDQRSAPDIANDLIDDRLQVHANLLMRLQIRGALPAPSATDPAGRNILKGTVGQVNRFLRSAGWPRIGMRKYSYCLDTIFVDLNEFTVCSRSDK